MFHKALNYRNVSLGGGGGGGGGNAVKFETRLKKISCNNAK